MTSEGARKAWQTRKRNAATKLGNKQAAAMLDADPERKRSKRKRTAKRKRPTLLQVYDRAARRTTPNKLTLPKLPKRRGSLEQVLRELDEARGHRERIYLELLRRFNELFELWK